jgi:hypothetical protein
MYMKKNRFLLKMTGGALAVLWLTLPHAAAQVGAVASSRTEVTAPMDLTITGVVTSDQGEPLPGVTVALRGTTIGTATGIDGRYTITVPTGQENGILVFSYIGYRNREVPINNQTTISLSLAIDMQALEEVVVIGYQTIRKQDLTGAWSSRPRTGAWKMNSSGMHPPTSPPSVTG